MSFSHTSLQNKNKYKNTEILQNLVLFSRITHHFLFCWSTYFYKNKLRKTSITEKIAIQWREFEVRFLAEIEFHTAQNPYDIQTAIIIIKSCFNYVGSTT